MRLIDTSVALLASAAPDRLSSRVRDALQQRGNTLSVISYWEIMLKTMKGSLDVGDPLMVDESAGSA